LKRLRQPRGCDGRPGEASAGQTRGRQPRPGRAHHGLQLGRALPGRWETAALLRSSTQAREARIPD